MQPASTYKVCPACGQSAQLDAALCLRCGHHFSTQFVQAQQQPTQAFYVAAKPQHLQDAANKKLAAGICGILVGSLGVHKFVLGYTTAGLVMLVGSVVTCGIAAPVFAVIGLVEGILYITKSDEEFFSRYMAQRTEWF